MSNSHLDTGNMELDTIATSDLDVVMENKEQTSLETTTAANPTSIPMSEDQVATLPVDMTAEEQSSPPLTSALEALLGGLDPPAEIPTEASTVSAHPPMNNSVEAEPATNDDTPMAIDSIPTAAGEVEAVGESTSSAPATTENLPAQAVPPTAAAEEEHPEWEVDSSPIESSSDDSSSDDSSSDESEKGENSYKLLSPEEQAQILMEEGGGSDDEGKAGKTGAGHRTKNEIPDVVVPKPDVTIPLDMPVMEVGNVETIVDNILLIKANTTGEYKVLETGSVLCLANKSVIGVVAETIGRVQQPFYSVMFTNAGELAEAGLEVGTTVFYPEKHATYVFTQALKAFKGTDASNIHDEEVGPDEMEFSDDEKEAEHKRKVKQAKSNKRGGNNGGSGRSGRSPYDAPTGISYDDAGEDDGPYKPLSRPAGFADTVGRNEPPQEGQYSSGMIGHSQTQSRDQGRGRGRGRGDRARGRGERGRGRGGNSDRGGRGGGGFVQTQQSHQNHQQAQFQPPPPPPPSGQFPQFTQMQQNPANIPSLGNGEYSPLQPQLPNWAQFAPQQQYAPSSFQQFQQFQQAFTNMQNMQNMSNGWQTNPVANPAASGAFVNPAFFNNPQNPQGGHSGQPSPPGPSNQWPRGQNGRGRGGL